MISEEMRSLTTEQLTERLQELAGHHTHLRFQKALQQLQGTHQLGLTRRDIARVKTLLREYEMGIRERKAE